MLLLFTQWRTVAFRIYLALDLAIITPDLEMDYIVDNSDTGDNANAQQ